MTGRHLLMVAGLVVAAWLALFGDKTPSAGIAEPVTHSARPSTMAIAKTTSLPPHDTSDAATKAAHEPVINALLPRDVLIGGAHVPVAADGLFASQSWAPPPPPPAKPLPPPPPTAPPLPFTYLGKKSEDTQWEVYLALGEQTLIVHEKTIIDGIYRIDSIKPPLLFLTYLPLQQVQTLSIGGSD